MVVVVFGDEKEVVNQSHGLLKPRVQHRASKGLGWKFADLAEQLHSSFPKPRQNVSNRDSIVIGFVSLAISEIGSGKFRASSQKITDTRDPQRLQIQQMSGLLLGRPFVAGLSNQHLPRNYTQHFLQPCRRSTQANAQIRILLDGKRELEFSFKPGRN